MIWTVAAAPVTKAPLTPGTGTCRLREDRTGQELLKIEPELTISGFLARIPVPVESMARTYAEALRAAGLPE